MKELPENQTLSKQINETLKDRVITEVFNATKYHKNTFYFGDPLTYSELLTGRRINSSMSFGMYVDIILDKETKISFGDGTNLKYGTISNKMPNNYQLLLALDNNTYLTFTVGMFGVIAAYTGIYNEIYYKKNLDNLSPLSDDFNEQYFEKAMRWGEAKIICKSIIGNRTTYSWLRKRSFAGYTIQCQN